MGPRTAHRVVRPAGLLLLTLLTMTLLSGCLDLSMHTRLDTDGSGTLRLEVLLGEELVEALGSFGEEITSDDLVQDGQTDLPREFAGRTRITPLDDGVGVSVEVDFDNIDELNLLLSDTTLDGADSDGLVDRVELDTDDDGDRVRFSADVGGTDSFEADDEFAMFFGAMAEPAISFSVELPGSIGENNADEVDGRTATWDLVAASGTTIFAESGTSTSLLDAPWLVAVVALVGLLALVLLVVVLTRLRRSSTSSTPTGAPGIAVPPVAPTTAAAPMASAPQGWGDAPGAPTGPPPLSPTGLPALTPTEPAPTAPPTATPPPAPPAPLAPPVTPPPVSPPPAAPSAGWYPDPGGSGQQRWWDGTRWTDHLH